MSIREDISNRILSRFEGKRIAVIGIGGGGDVYSVAPLVMELERRYRAHVYPGGLTWKRAAHDPLARPRTLDEFLTVQRINNFIGIAGPYTITKEGVQHAEAHLSAVLDGRDVLIIDPSPGSRAVCTALSDMCAHLSIDAVIGLDVGGDALASGSESTLESPLCDQTLLWALAERGELVVVASLGTDGEMTPADLARRIETVQKRGGYLGAFSLNPADLDEYDAVTAHARSESSKFALGVMRGLSGERLEKLHVEWNGPDLDVARLVSIRQELSLRNGTRRGFLCEASALYLFFEARSVRDSAELSKVWDPDRSISEMAATLHTRGIKTEVSVREDGHRTSAATADKV